MILDTKVPIDPVGSRQAILKQRFGVWITLAGGFLVFVPVWGWLSSLLPSTFLIVIAMLAGNALAFAACCYLYLRWKNQPFRLRCEGCRKVILSNTPWVCGHCGSKNLHGDRRSFLDACPSCGYLAKAYKCHHADCEAYIFFSEDHDLANTARRLVSNPEKTEKRTEALEQHQQLLEDKANKLELLELDVTKTRMNAVMKAIRKLSDQSNNSLMQEEEKILDRYMQEVLSVEDAVAKRRNAVDTEFGPKSPEAKRRHRILDRFEEIRLAQKTEQNPRGKSGG